MSTQPDDMSLEALQAWAAEQNRQLCEDLWAMPTHNPEAHR